MALTKKECIQLNQAVFSMANAYRSRMVQEGLPEESGLSLSDRSMLMVLGQSQPIAARDLAKLMDINPGTISVYVQRLVEMGLVVRTQGEKDRRTWALSLTEKGGGAFSDTIDRAAAYTTSFLEPLNEDEQATLHGLMLRVSKGLGYPW